MIKSGIYCIKNIITNKIYVGSAINIKSRFNTHKHNLRFNKHPNKYLQNAWNKYNEENFKFEILELVEDKLKLIKREQFWLDYTKCYETGYNSNCNAESNLGKSFGNMSKEHKLKISKANKGKKRSLECKLHNSIGQFGKKLSEQHIKNAIEGRKGYKHSNETKNKIGLANSKKEKWPHKDKNKCNCNDCKEKRNFVRRKLKINCVMILGDLNVPI